MTKIAIIGAGWYGCHIASSLLSLGIDAEVFEKESDILTRASGNNQFRLHLGFHYARNYDTRIQSRDGYQRFIERYPTLSSKTQNGNIYSVPKLDSLIDFKTYKTIMTSSGIEYKEIENPEWSNGIQGSVLCDERVIETKKAREYFKKKLNGRLHLSTPVESMVEFQDKLIVNNEKFDFVIDCTWGHLAKTRSDVFYEPTILLYYKGPEDFPAFTLVDGPLISIYPTEEKGLYTLSSVTHTPLAMFDCPNKARDFVNNDVTDDIINDKRILMEEHVSKYVPGFKDMFEYQSPQISIKTKIIGATDDRSCSVEMRGRYISIMSGKIDTIFHGMERVIYYLQSFKG